MAKFSLIVLDRARLAATEHGERQEIGHILRHVAQEIGDGVTKSGDIKDRAGTVVGEWSFGGPK